MPDQSKNDDDLDLLWGAAQIAQAINCPERRTWYLLAKGKLPAKKCGRTWVISRERLREFFGNPTTA
jgi:hypothetical protein